MACRTLDIAAADGSIDAELSTPGDGTYPAVLLFTDIRGIRPAYRALCRRIADAGYAVLMPNIFYRWARPPILAPGETFADPEVRKRLFAWRAALGPEQQAADFTACLAALDDAPEARTDRIGTVGYCMTGGFALRLAALHPDRVAAAASFHGGSLADPGDPLSVHEQVGAIRGRVYVGHADTDSSAPPEQIGRLDQALADAHVDFTTELYRGAQHGFAIDGPAHDEKAATRHLDRLLTLFAETL